jgi:hypothetical protein
MQHTDSEVTVKVSLQRDIMQGVHLQIFRTSLRYRGFQRNPLALTRKAVGFEVPPMRVLVPVPIPDLSYA